MVEVARGLDARGAGTTIQSICSSDFRPAVNRIIELIADALGGACLPRPLNPAADGTVATARLGTPGFALPNMRFNDGRCDRQGRFCLKAVARAHLTDGDTARKGHARKVKARPTP